MRTITASRRILTKVLRMALLHRKKRECANCSTETVSREPCWASRHDVPYSLNARGSVIHFTFGELRVINSYGHRVFRSTRVCYQAARRKVAAVGPNNAAKEMAGALPGHMHAPCPAVRTSRLEGSGRNYCVRAGGSSSFLIKTNTISLRASP